MRRVLIAALATAATGLSATVAEATAAPVGITECTSGASCVSGTTNVNIGTFQNNTTVNPVTGQIGMAGGGNGTVYFTSTDGWLSTNTGAATVFRTDGFLLSQISFFLLGGQGFTSAEFNLENGSPSLFTILITDDQGQTYNALTDHLQGSNIFDVVANAGTIITRVDVTTSGGGFADLKQLRLVGGSIAPVPEPATWGMMLLGFAGIGVALRRGRRRGKPALMQIA